MKKVCVLLVLLHMYIAMHGSKKRKIEAVVWRYKYSVFCQNKSVEVDCPC